MGGGCIGGLQNFYENHSWIDYFGSYKGGFVLDGLL